MNSPSHTLSISPPPSPSELLRYFRAKGKENKALAAPHLSAIFDHFNRVSN